MSSHLQSVEGSDESCCNRTYSQSRKSKLCAASFKLSDGLFKALKETVPVFFGHALVFTDSLVDPDSRFFVTIYAGQAHLQVA